MFSKKNSCDKKVAKGFTLVEIIVVLVILAILAAATIPSLLGLIDDAKFKTIDNEARVVRNAAQAYATEQSAGGETDTDIEGEINGVINSNHALHNLLQNDASGTVFKTEVKNGKIKKFNYTKEIINQDEDFISDKVRYVVFDDEKTSLLHATDPITNINIDNFKANIIAEVTAALTSNDPESFKSTLTSSLTTDLTSSLSTSVKTDFKTNFRTELGSNVVDLIYPVGSFYVSYNSASPATLFGGTWTQITNRFLYCADSSGTTGGNSTHTHSISGSTGSHTLTIDEIPSHSHSYYENYRTNSAGWDHVSSNSWNNNWGTKTTGSTGGGKGHSHSVSITSQSASSMPPYMTVYCWRRTA